MSGKVAGLFGMLLAVYACSSDDPPTSAPQAFCNGLCKAALACGDTSSCQSYCIEERPGLALLSRDGAEHLGDCIAHFDCATLSDDALWQPAFESCWDEARAQVKPTPALRSFCEPYAEVWFECGYLFSTADCENEFGIWSDSTLQRLSACDHSSCDTLDQCVSGVLGS